MAHGNGTTDCNAPCPHTLRSISSPSGVTSCNRSADCSSPSHSTRASNSIPSLGKGRSSDKETATPGFSANQTRFPEYNNSALFAVLENVSFKGSFDTATETGAVAGPATFSAAGRVITCNGQPNASNAQSVNAARKSGDPLMPYFSASTTVFTLWRNIPV